MNLLKNELITFIANQKKIFDTVRLVDVSMTTQCLKSDDGKIGEST